MAWGAATFRIFNPAVKPQTSSADDSAEQPRLSCDSSVLSLEVHGQVIDQRQQRHTHVEWLKFLRQSARDILHKVIRVNSRLSSKQNGALH